jgi:hypothetical protein
MSSGAVPLVYAHGGPAAIVGDVTCGVVYSTVAELAARTVALAADPAGIRRRADAAIERASEFSFDHFADHVLELVDRVGVRPSPAIEERA